MKIEPTDTGVVIDFEQTQRARVRIFFWFQAAAGLGMALAFALAAGAGLPPLAWLMFAVFAGGYGLYAYRFLAKATSRERLLVTPHQLQLENRTLFGRTVRRYEVKRISNWRYTGAAPAVPHPLAPQSFDYLGFDTTQKVINQVHDGGNFSFDYDGRPVHFGRNTYSWQAEEVAAWVQKIIPKELALAGADDAFSKEYGLDSGAMP